MRSARLTTVIGLVAAVAACALPATGRTAGATLDTTSGDPHAAVPLAQPSGDAGPSDPRVGALFLGGTALHTCSAAVLNSTSGDLVLTAAHCVLDGVPTTFIPGFGDDGAEEAWQVNTVYLDPDWTTGQDPQSDFAILRVGRDDGGTVMAAAGGGLTLATSPPPGTTVTVTGYPTGEGGGASECRGTTEMTPQGFPSLPCAGITDGFSGAPWVSGATVAGIVGGLDGGGCDDDVSYSPRFDDRLTRLLTRAEAGGEGDAAPAAPESDC